MKLKVIPYSLITNQQVHACQDNFVPYTWEPGTTVVVFPDSIALAINSACTSNQQAVDLFKQDPEIFFVHARVWYSFQCSCNLNLNGYWTQAWPLEDSCPYQEGSHGDKQPCRSPIIACSPPCSDERLRRSNPQSNQFHQNFLVRKIKGKFRYTRHKL